jgi:hypothetical protein
MPWYGENRGTFRCQLVSGGLGPSRLRRSMRPSGPPVTQLVEGLARWSSYKRTFVQ